MVRYCLLFLLSIFSLGCATYQTKVDGIRQQLTYGQYTVALDELRALSLIEDKDQLLYLLDYATALQMAGKYQESKKVFVQADKLAEQLSYYSVTKIIGATLGGEESVQYKGDSFEIFLINSMNALNFMAVQDLDGAMVEARRINEKISKMKMDGREPYELSPFATYLSAMIYEAQGNFDSAYIAYEQTYSLNPNMNFIEEDLIRASKLARREETHQKWKKAFPHVKGPTVSGRSQDSEIIILTMHGWGPRKRTSQADYSLPELSPVYNTVTAAQTLVNSKDYGSTKTIYDVESVAIQTLSKDMGALIARRIGALGVKAVVADQLRQRDDGLGDLAWILMNVADRADLRQWSTLPRHIQLQRVRVPAGKHEIQLRAVGSSQQNVGSDGVTREVELKPRQTYFLVHRFTK